MKHVHKMAVLAVCAVYCGLLCIQSCVEIKGGGYRTLINCIYRSQWRMQEALLGFR